MIHGERLLPEHVSDVKILVHHYEDKKFHILYTNMSKSGSLPTAL